jgi:SAM-dependent methyltransferase
VTPADPPPPPRIFSSTRQRAAFARAVGRQQRADAARFLFKEMCEEVKERLSFMRFEPQEVLIIGDPTRLLAEAMPHHARLTMLPGGHWTADRPLDGGLFDLILHDTSLAAINDLPGALLHFRQALKPGGLFIASIVGAGSLPVLRAAMLAAEPDRPYPRLHPQIDNRTASGLLQRAGFTQQVVDSHSLTVRYSALPRLVADLRDQGLGSVLAERSPPLSVEAYRRAQEAFRKNADAEERVSERFEIVNMTAWHR